MVGFENFHVGAWVDVVFIRQSKQSRVAASRQLRKSTWRTAIAATLFASVAVAAEANVTIRETVTTLAVNAGTAAGSVSTSSGDVPVGYWPKLLHEASGWRNLEESATEPPDPII